MKQELNEEFKARYFMQYAHGKAINEYGFSGKIVGIVKSEVENRWLCLTENDAPNEGHLEDYLSDCCLSLRPLSSLTDEEIITLCSKVHSLAFQGNNPPKKWEVTIHHTGHATVKNKNNDYSFSVFLMDGNVDVYYKGELTTSASNHAGLDYLRSEGFATDFMGYQWEELVKAGWLVIEGKEEGKQ